MHRCKLVRVMFQTFYIYFAVLCICLNRYVVNIGRTINVFQNEFKVSERKFTMKDLRSSLAENRVSFFLRVLNNCRVLKKMKIFEPFSFGKRLSKQCFNYKTSKGTRIRHKSASQSTPVRMFVCLYARSIMRVIITKI